MKSFIYTIREGKAPHDGSGISKTVRVYQIVRGKPRLTNTRTEKFVSEFQLCMMALETTHVLPKAAFAVHEFAGSYKYGAPHLLEEAGFARVTQIG